MVVIIFRFNISKLPRFWVQYPSFPFVWLGAPFTQLDIYIISFGDSLFAASYRLALWNRLLRHIYNNILRYRWGCRRCTHAWLTCVRFATRCCVDQPRQPKASRGFWNFARSFMLRVDVFISNYHRSNTRAPS